MRYDVTVDGSPPRPIRTFRQLGLYDVERRDLPVVETSRVSVGVRVSMQFRTNTLLVVTATCSIALALSIALPLGMRAFLAFAVLGIWLGLGLVAWALIRYPKRPTIALCTLVAGSLLETASLSLAAVLLGLAVRELAGRFGV